MLAIAMYIPGNDAQSRLLRKTLCQNCNLMAVLVFRSISESVRSRLQTLEDVVRAGLVTRSLCRITKNSFAQRIPHRFHDEIRNGMLQSIRIGYQPVLVARFVVCPPLARGSKTRQNYRPLRSQTYHECKMIATKCNQRQFLFLAFVLQGTAGIPIQMRHSLVLRLGLYSARLHSG